MTLTEALRAGAEAAPAPTLEHVRRDLGPAWIDAALAAAGTAPLRRRRLPAEQVIWLVLGMALYRDRSIVEVAAALDLALPGARGPTAAPSAVSQARTRVGPAPLAWLFARGAETWAPASAGRCRAVPGGTAGVVWRSTASMGRRSGWRTRRPTARTAASRLPAAGAASAPTRSCAWSRSWRGARTCSPPSRSGRP
ncbi:hypothetical protein tb265_40740 [Gemmatimonadetes bacterium T265]|nr:hypothetical protein tb265_40740 [Gemmatimonadetes bacterium T265]